MRAGAIGPRQAVGYVIGFEITPAVAETRPILARLDSPVRLTSDMIDLARWISDRVYLSTVTRGRRDAAGGIALPGAGARGPRFGVA